MELSWNCSRPPRVTAFHSPISLASLFCLFIMMRRAWTSVCSASARYAVVLGTAEPLSMSPDLWTIGIGLTSGFFAAGAGLVTIGAYAANAQARLSKEVAALEGKLSKESAALDAKLAGIKETITKEVDAKMAGAKDEVKATMVGTEKAITKEVDAKIAGFKEAADLKVRSRPARARAAS